MIIIYGPRRVGKTTVARQVLAEAPVEEQLYLNCDEMVTADALKPTSLAALGASDRRCKTYRHR